MVHHLYFLKGYSYYSFLRTIHSDSFLPVLVILYKSGNQKTLYSSAVTRFILHYFIKMTAIYKLTNCTKVSSFLFLIESHLEQELKNIIAK